jgi:hypothetical protein
MSLLAGYLTEPELAAQLVPISVALAKKLERAARGRAEGDRLLLERAGSPWNEENVHGDHRDQLAEIVKAMGLNPKISGYCFRHSSIVRQLKRGVPTRIVAANHNTSVQQIEANYSKHIVDHSDQITRAALLDHQPAPVADNWSDSRADLSKRWERCLTNSDPVPNFGTGFLLAR